MLVESSTPGTCRRERTEHAFLAALLLATGAAVVTLAAYGLITWRRIRWWPPVLLGAAPAG